MERDLRYKQRLLQAYVTQPEATSHAMFEMFIDHILTNTHLKQVCLDKIVLFKRSFLQNLPQVLLAIIFSFFELSFVAIRFPRLCKRFRDIFNDPKHFHLRCTHSLLADPPPKLLHYIDRTGVRIFSKHSCKLLPNLRVVGLVDSERHETSFHYKFDTVFESEYAVQGGKTTHVTRSSFKCIGGLDPNLMNTYCHLTSLSVGRLVWSHVFPEKTLLTCLTQLAFTEIVLSPNTKSITLPDTIREVHWLKLSDCKHAKIVCEALARSKVESLKFRSSTLYTNSRFYPIPTLAKLELDFYDDRFNLCEHPNVTFLCITNLSVRDSMNYFPSRLRVLHITGATHPVNWERAFVYTEDSVEDLRVLRGFHICEMSQATLNKWRNRYPGLNIMDLSD